MKQFLFLATAITLATAASVAQADSAQKPVHQWTCEEFLAIDTVSQPSVIAYAQALDSKGKPQEGMFDVVTATTVSQLTAAECQVEPKASFINKLRGVWEKQGK